MAHVHRMLDAKATQTLTIYNIYGFPLQQWLQELATVLRFR